MASTIPLRIAVVQFSPKIGQVQANIKRVHELCRKIKPNSVDLLCLPEMALTGYVFENAAAISPYLEAPRTGPTANFCSDLAKKLECYVFAGYPEKLDPTEIKEMRSRPKEAELEGSSLIEPTKDHAVHLIGANSAVIYGPQGEWVGGYRKTNLFETDKSWAKPGTGFSTFELPSPLRNTSLAICMDLNPQPPTHWTVSTGPYELADYCASQGARLVIMLDSWLQSETAGEEENDWQTLNYWAARFRPLWGKPDDKGGWKELSDEKEENLNDSKGSETIVVVCNRTGSENGKAFAGSSAIFSMQRGRGRPRLLDVMTRTEESVRVWNLLV